MALTIGVAVDGSKLSKMAEEFAGGLMQRRAAGDSLVALHIAPAPDKLELVPDHLKPAKLE